MGNKLCKRKVDVENVKSPFDRLVHRLHLRPNAWKSDPQLNKKDGSAASNDANKAHPDKQNMMKVRTISKSSDWTNVDLTVPEKEHVHLPNPKLTAMFSRDSGTTPVPPPRKHKKNFRERIEAVAKSGLQAFQSNKKPVEEPLFVKKNISYKCPICDADEVDHNRDHHHHHHEEDKSILRDKQELDKKRRKNLSVMSLPNYDELKLTQFQDKDPTLPEPNKEKRPSYPTVVDAGIPKKARSGSTGKLDAYITRCRSISSLLPQHLKKVQHPPKNRRVPHKVDGDSDDSFGGLEDWDLGLIEHYNPKDASLPRARKDQRNSQEVMAGIEDLVVQDIVESNLATPTPCERKSESQRVSSKALEKETLKFPTPPQSPKHFSKELPTEEDGHVEHSSLLRILEKFTREDVKNGSENQSGNSSLTPSLVEFERSVAGVEEFISAEKSNAS